MRERLKPIVGIAAALTLFGAFLMSGAGRSLAALNIGDLACLVSALFYAGWMVALSRHAVAMGCAIATTFLHALLSAVCGAVLLVVMQPDQPGTLAGALPEILYLGVFSTAIAFGLTAAAQAHVSASTAAILVAAESIFGAAGAVLILGERPGHFAIIGAALILIAITMAACVPAAAVGQPHPRTVKKGQT
jgi:drug/metabolite transporter (DMT)-like permease